MISWLIYWAYHLYVIPWLWVWYTLLVRIPSTLYEIMCCGNGRCMISITHWIAPHMICSYIPLCTDISFTICCCCFFATSNRPTAGTPSLGLPSLGVGEDESFHTLVCNFKTRYIYIENTRGEPLLRTPCDFWTVGVFRKLGMQRLLISNMKI